MLCARPLALTCLPAGVPINTAVSVPYHCMLEHPEDWMDLAGNTQPTIGTTACELVPGKLPATLNCNSAAAAVLTPARVHPVDLSTNLELLLLQVPI